MKFQLMRQLLVFALILGFGLTTYAQKGKKGGETPASTCDVSQASMLKMYDKMFHDALNFGDIAVATNAVYGLMSLKPDSVALLDTLSALYFQRQAWPQVVLVTTSILEKNANSESALELRAVANQSLGRAKEALADYEALYGKAKNPYHLYEIASLQFAMKRFGESELSANRIISDQSVKDETISISLQDGRSQNVPLHAAALNLIGVMNLEQGKKDLAKSAFETAIKIYPEFLLAKNNLDAMAEMK
jgi:tetratricopeptide (TPR) repeat protein